MLSLERCRSLHFFSKSDLGNSEKLASLPSISVDTAEIWPDKEFARTYVATSAGVIITTLCTCNRSRKPRSTSVRPWLRNQRRVPRSPRAEQLVRPRQKGGEEWDREAGPMQSNSQLLCSTERILGVRGRWFHVLSSTRWRCAAPERKRSQCRTSG